MLLSSRHAVVVVPALVPCPSASALTCPRRRCRHHQRRWTHLSDRRRPPPPPPLPPPPSPRELLLSRRSLFGITVVDAAAATADDANDADDADDEGGDSIPPPRSKSRHRPPPPSTAIVRRRHNHCLHQAVFADAAANLVVVNLLSAADTLIISCNLVDCCVIAICSQCFVTTGDTVVNPAATKTGNTVTCHSAAAYRREAPPGAWEVGVYLTAGAEVNHQMSPRAVRWEPRLDNDGDTVGGSVVGTMTCTGGGSSIVLLVSGDRKVASGDRRALYLVFLLSWVEISLLIPTHVTNKYFRVKH